MVRTILTGSGHNSRVVSHRREPKVEPKPTAINPAGVSQRDVSTAFRKERVEMGPGYTQKPMGSTGIANARQGHAGVGPGGGGRTIYKSGSQSPTPPADGMPAGRDTLSEFGRDIPGRRGNR
jgi:hypothetical protein